MDENYKAATNYLSTPAGSFWKWVDDGKVVAWRHGATVAFREELAAVLQRLAPRGLPPIDSVLLLIAATRAYWMDDSAALRKKLLESLPSGSSDHRVLEAFRDFGIPARLDREETHVRLTLFGQLDRIHRFLSEVTQTVDGKTLLAEVAFEAIPPVLTGPAARMVCDILTHGRVPEQNSIPNLPRLHGARAQVLKVLVAELQQLSRGLTGITEESLRLRSATGLDEPPLPADVILPAEPAAIRSLLQQLALDDELCGLCRIARNLSAVLQLPRAITDSDELPLGGVSDISNRGTLDRLLLSELAHDDLMLATRVALNEALYLRREAPPSPPPQRRHILIDSGLRMWGVPRVYAAAVMLSMAATGAEGASTLAYRAVDGDVEPINPASRQGLINHLEALEPEVHPGRSLKAFFDRIADDDQPGEAIVITSDTVLSDPQFQRALSDLEQSNCYLASVNREGDFQLWLRGARGSKLLTSLSLDLDELLKPIAKTHVKLVDRQIDPSPPAIFFASPMPLRLPHQFSSGKESMWSVRLPVDRKKVILQTESAPEPVLVTSDTMAPTMPEFGTMILTRDRRLIFFDATQRGAIQIASEVPNGRLLWSGSSSDKHWSYALIYRQGEPGLYLLAVNVVLNKLIATRKLESTFVAQSGPGAQVQGAAAWHGVLYVIYRTRIEAFDLGQGNRLHEMALEPHMKWSNGRFFWNEKASAYAEWTCLVCDATGLRLEPVKLRGPELTGHLIWLFDRPGHDGPFGVHLRGSIANLSNQTEWNWTQDPRSNPKVIEIDECGDRILIEQDIEDKTRRRVRRLIQVSTKFVEELPQPFKNLAAWDFRRMHQGSTLMHRFTRIQVSSDHKLTLTSKSQTNWHLAVRNSRLAMCQAVQGQVYSRSVSFEPGHHPHAGCTMLVATWQDGSRALVDSRGLLHLQSSDHSIAEATLVLNDCDIACWSNDGFLCGNSYFVDIGGSRRRSAEEFMNQILKPFIERLQ